MKTNQVYRKAERISEEKSEARIRENRNRTYAVVGDKIQVIDGGGGAMGADKMFGVVVSFEDGMQADFKGKFHGTGMSSIFIQNRDGEVWCLGQDAKYRIVQKISVS